MDRLSDYDYTLPQEAIAQEPLVDRSASKLLVLQKDTGQIEHRVFREVPGFFSPGDLLVVNDTRVTAIRLIGTKETGGTVEILLMREESPRRYLALAKPGRRLRPGVGLVFEHPEPPGRTTCRLPCVVIEDRPGGQKLIEFPDLPDLRAQLETLGSVPLPPYITRHLDSAARYQTVYADKSGSAAAPTAGLHFTDRLIQELIARNVGIAKVTLDIGLDTFRPIQVEDLRAHKMHGEMCTVPAETALAVNSCKGRVIAVGTTVARTLEAFAEPGAKRSAEAGTKETKLFIRPGYRFKIVDGMFTNFHMPRTSMLCLISALAGRENVLRSYAQALEHGYRFLSFGDAMLIY